MDLRRSRRPAAVKTPRAASNRDSMKAEARATAGGPLWSSPAHMGCVSVWSRNRPRPAARRTASPLPTATAGAVPGRRWNCTEHHAEPSA
jgi:hypothetical protein